MSEDKNLFRYVVSRHEEEFEADCLDAGCCGLHDDTVMGAVHTLHENLTALRDGAVEMGSNWRETPSAERLEELTAVQRGHAEAGLVGYGAFRLVDGKFDIAYHFTHA